MIRLIDWYKELKQESILLSIFGFPLLATHLILFINVLLLTIGTNGLNDSIFWSPLLSLMFLAQTLLFFCQYILTIIWMIRKSARHKVYFFVATAFLLSFFVGLGLFTIGISNIFIYSYWYWTYKNYKKAEEYVTRGENILDDTYFYRE